jgi:FAD:protein FMN transferase
MAGKRVTRRRALTILATTAASLASGRAFVSNAVADHEWRGFAMGTDARIVFNTVDADTARSAAVAASLEIERLESALSLFREDSEISRLNRDNFLNQPSGDIKRALELALAVCRATGGLFDPTVQALWEMYVDWFAAPTEAPIPPQERVAEALAAVDWRAIKVTANSIQLGRAQRLTLNGLGQGYVTDRVADLLRGYGFRHVLVDLGEQRALGSRADGEPWRIALEGADCANLVDGALATSESAGCVLGANGAVHHLFDPRTGRSAGHWRRITVHHRSAAIADGLSTALFAATADDLSAILRTISGAIVWTTDPRGRTQRWASPT